jgi:hypothetical protein
VGRVEERRGGFRFGWGNMRGKHTLGNLSLGGMIFKK